MHQTPRRTLAKIVEKYGDELISDPRRTEALLNDLCGKHTREIFVLIQAQRRRVPAELRESPRWIPTSTTINRLITNLENQLALTPEAATWAVESWAIALGLMQEEAEESTWYNLLPAGLLGRKPQASTQTKKPPKNTAKSGPAPTSPQTAAKPKKGATVGGTTSAGTGQSTTGQNPPDSVQSKPVRTIPRQTGNRRADGARSGLARFGAYIRKQAPGLLLWTTVLCLSLVTGWALLSGTPLPAGTLGPGQPGLLPTAISQNGGTSDPSSAPGNPQLGIAPTETPGQSILTRAYAPPQVAVVVAADGLNRRQEPSTDAVSMGLLAAGQPVTIVGYSGDGDWARLDDPNSGWVSTQFLALETPAGRPIRIFLRNARIQPSLDAVVLRSEPSPNAAEAGTVSSGAEVTIVAATIDNLWFQIGSPQSGWLMNGTVEIQSSPSTAVGRSP